MVALPQGASSMTADNDPNAILNECHGIRQSIDEIRGNLTKLRNAHRRALADADSSSTSDSNRVFNDLSSATIRLCQETRERVHTVKSKPRSQSDMNSKHVRSVEHGLREVIQEYRTALYNLEELNKDHFVRQYRIVDPDVSEEEARAAAADPARSQVFSHALMQSDRQVKARATLSAVQHRHKTLAKIEQQVDELAQLFQATDALVDQQDAHIKQVEQNAEDVSNDVNRATEEIGVAVSTARKTRGKKFICLGILVAIVVVLIVVILVYIFVIRGTSKK